MATAGADARRDGAGDERFDYIVVGSGAGGGPLAARLVEAGKKVLVLEAGSRGGAGDAPEISQVPGLHAASAEDPALSWRFFVEHYSNPPAGPDPKRVASTPPDPQRTGIFYPRAATLGGCTAHNAMITIAGPDSDWDDLANYLEDDSWRSPAMRTYFQKLERNEYLPRPRPPETTNLGKLRDGFWWLFGRDVDHTGGRHGFDGWLRTSVLDLKLGLEDRQLVGVLRAALRQAKSAGLDRSWTWIRTILRGRASQALDPNHATTQAQSPEGVVLIPMAVCGGRTTNHEVRAEPNVRRGRRSGPRERLLAVREASPTLLEIRTGCLVTRVLFAEPERDDAGNPTSAPEAIGVEYRRGERLYRAHVDPSDAPGALERAFVKEGGEVVLCGGAFNTPQLLMLSGIGDAGRLAASAAADGDAGLCALRDAESRPIAGPAGAPWRVDLRGVGCNLQDRYEVSLVSEMNAEFDLLKGATLELDAADPHLREWREGGAGLYSTNGAVLGIFKRSSPESAQPDLFIFGAPFPFRGYEPGYSAVGRQHDKFTWVILKGGTRNNRGTVRLRSTDPRDTPEINFRYFNEPDRPDASWPADARKDPDLLALVHGVKFVRGISRNAGLYVKRECHPGLVDVPTDDDEKIKAWILREAWGHHACGTCRMGPDEDPSAVLDSRFRVLGVRGLRVVDASIFPRIPGYFLVTNIYMASEKAADVMLEDARTGQDDACYPAALRALESEAIGARRRRVAESPDAALAGAPPTRIDVKTGERPGEWPRDLTGLALSGGGVRSATFNLGVLQALARARRLRKVDVLSTVSGGGYIGSFLGRCFDRLRSSKVQGLQGVSYPPGPAHVEGELADPTSFELAWLRRQSNYLAPAGLGDETLNAANYFRSLASVHLVVGLLIFALLGTMAFVRYKFVDPVGGVLRLFTVGGGGTPVADVIRSLLGPFYSPWFLLFEVFLLVLVLPLGAGYWIVCQDRHERFQGVGLALLGVIAATLLYLGLSGGLASEPLLLGLSLLLAFWHVELAWRKARGQEAALGAGDVSTRRLRTRNILTYELGFALTLAAGAFALAVADALGFALQRYAARRDQYGWTFSALLVTVAGLAPVVRMAAGLFLPGRGGRDDSSSSRDLRAQVGAGLLAAALFAAPMVLYSYAVHAAYGGGGAIWRGGWATFFAAALTGLLAHPKALTFVNRSSFSQMYAARLARAYLGATNPERRRPAAGDVTEVVAGDDVGSLRDYRPHETGGPLHLINLTVNQTIDFSSLRGNRARQGESLAVSPIGLTVGAGWHSAWGGDVDDRGRIAVEPLGAQPGSGHPSLDVTGVASGRMEMLPLRDWVALSGAAVGPAQGQGTRLGTSLLFGLANLRTGRWWDSGLPLAARRGFPQVGLLRRFLYIGPRTLMTQTLLLSEWLALYPGPWGRYWHVSDGGFFENLGAYELIRRRVPRIIACDASADPAFTMDGLGELIRKVRIDFDARVEPVPPAQITAWMNAGLVPAAVAARLGVLNDLKPGADGHSRRHATLFRVHYGRGGASSYLLYLKASVTGDEDPDVLEYKALHGDFPHESTVDQYFDEAQWESYRRLGEHAAAELFGGSDWFWKLP